MSVSTPGHGMIHCPECGWEIDPDDEMCPNCGAYLADYENLEPSEDGTSSASEHVAACAFQELPEAAARRWDVAADDLPGGRVEQDRVRSASVFESREPDRSVEELGILEVDLGAGVLDDVHEFLQQLPLMAIDVLPGESLRFVLVDLRVQEPGFAHHAAGVEGHLEPEGQFVFPRREVPGSTAQDLPEVIAPKIPGTLLIRPGPREDPGVGGCRIDLEHVERKIDTFERGDAGGLPEVVRLHHAALHPTLDRTQSSVAVHPGREHRVRQHEGLVPADPRGGAAVRARHDDLACGQVQRSATLRATDRLYELGHADATLMGRSNIEASWEVSAPSGAAAC